MKNKEKQVMEKLADCHSNDLIEVYEEQGEKAFRNVAKFMGLKKKDIDSAIKELKGGKMVEKNKKSVIKDIYDGEGITVWEDGELVTIAIGLTTIAIEKGHWEEIKEDFKKILDL